MDSLVDDLAPILGMAMPVGVASMDPRSGQQEVMDGPPNTFRLVKRLDLSVFSAVILAAEAAVDILSAAVSAVILAAEPDGRLVATSSLPH
jgi:hypothetical protein